MEPLATVQDGYSARIAGLLGIVIRLLQLERLSWLTIEVSDAELAGRHQGVVVSQLGIDSAAYAGTCKTLRELSECTRETGDYEKVWHSS
jgi:hypothetical protein